MRPVERSRSHRRSVCRKHCRCYDSIEHLLRNPWHCQGPGLLRVTRSQWCGVGHKKVQAQKRNQIYCYLTKVAIQLPRVSKTCSYTAHGSTHEMVRHPKSESYASDSWDLASGSLARFGPDPASRVDLDDFRPRFPKPGPVQKAHTCTKSRPPSAAAAAAAAADTIRQLEEQDQHRRPQLQLHMLPLALPLPPNCTSTASRHLASLCTETSFKDESPTPYAFGGGEKGRGRCLSQNGRDRHP